jgi:hypothetical protein
MNNRISKKTTKQSFRSSGDVNNYNKFLLNLDQQQTKEAKEAKETNNVNITYAKNITNDYTKIIDYLKYIEKEYDTYKSSINQPIVSNEMGIDPNRLAFICHKKKKMEEKDQEKKDLEKEQQKKNLEKEQEDLIEKRKVNIQI